MTTEEIISTKRRTHYSFTMKAILLADFVQKTHHSPGFSFSVGMITSLFMDKTVIKTIIVFIIIQMEACCIVVHQNLSLDRSKFYLKSRRISTSRIPESLQKRRKSVLSPFLSERTSPWFIIRQMGPLSQRKT